MTDSRIEIAFPRLSPEQIAAVETRAEVREFADGEYLWKTGDRELCFFIVKSGQVEVVEDSSGVRKRVAVHEPGEFTGDVDLLSGRPTVVSGIALGDCEIIQLTADCLRKIVKERPELSDLILRAFLMRRVLLLEDGIVGIRLIGSRFCACTHAIRDFLARNRVPFTWLDVERNEEVKELLLTLEIREDETPVVMLNDGTILKNPPLSELGERVGVRRSVQQEVFDLVVVGAGPAGLAASVYGASEGLRTLLVDRIAPGGQAGTSSKIENYLGFPTGLSGQNLADRALVQAEKFGTVISVPRDVVRLECGEGSHSLTIGDGEEVQARAVILATGAQYRKLNVPGYEKLEMSGIYYAATGAEAQLCREGDVAIVGAGNSAGQAAVFLANFARKVWIIVRGDGLEKSMSSYLARRIEGIDNVEVLTVTEIVAVHGDRTIDMIEAKDRHTQTVKCMPVVGLFVFTGAIPQTQWLGDRVRLDPKGFVLTGPAVVQADAWPLRRAPLFLETSCPGVFAAGDVRAGSVKRVASAVGEGSMSVAFVHEYLQGTVTA